MDLVLLVLLEAQGVPADSLDFFVESMESAFGFDGGDVDFVDFGDVFAEISLVDGLDVGPVVLDSDFFELGLVLVVPGPVVLSLLLGEGSGAGHVQLPPVRHLYVFGDEFAVCNLGVALYDKKLLIVFLAGDK